METTLDELSKVQHLKEHIYKFQANMEIVILKNKERQQFWEQWFFTDMEFKGYPDEIAEKHNAGCSEQVGN